MVEESLLIPYAKQALLGDVYESARVVAEDYDESGHTLDRARAARGDRAAAARLRGLMAADRWRGGVVAVSPTPRRPDLGGPRPAGASRAC